MKVVVAGASGFLGTHLCAELTGRGYQVTRLVRRTATVAEESTWDPYRGFLDQEVISTAQVVVNLAGAPTVGNPHSATWAEELRESRVTTTRVLAEAVAAAPQPPIFLAGNGISYYGDHGQGLVTESSASLGEAFLTQVTRDWQDATQAASQAGATVTILRTAPVIDHRSAPLKLLLPLAKWGLATRIGSGLQYFPIISLRDWVGAVCFLAEHPLDGPANLCAPKPATQAEFTEELATMVGRTARLRAPAWVVNKAAGRLSTEVLGSIRAIPEALLKAGYTFVDPGVSEVLRSSLGSQSPT